MRFEFLPIRGEIQNYYVGIDLFSQSVARQVFSALLSLTTVFGMGTGGPSPQSTPTSCGYTLSCTLKTKQSNLRLNYKRLHFFRPQP